MTTTDPPHPVPALEEHAADGAVERVLFATDGGEAGAGALRWVARRAKSHRLDVEILTVVEQEWVTGELTTSQFDDAGERAVAAARQALERTAPSAVVSTGVGWGDPRTAFSRASEDKDLLVVGSNRTGRLSALLGSTFPMKLVEGAKCPVVVVPRNWQPSHGAVVVGVQGDGSDEAAVRFAAREATILHRELRVVHSWSVPTVLGPEIPMPTDEAGVADTHDVVLDRVLAELRIMHPGLEIRGVLAEGEAADVLAREATGEELLVVGSHGWTVMDRFFLGSISREVLTRPPCPVAVVRPREKGR
ncbi:universal stress protein [Naasia sp. SYSU D00057]|uniref:universal stress protein n=1 Tax=Naasia sp. SYSU D00057 TaxID=2817380 RepID=UPI001B309999|nr:universal stress protein [Naasia sp. SYSU D00057]